MTLARFGGPGQDSNLQPDRYGWRLSPARATINVWSGLQSSASPW
jgi:hypothetical protein